MSAGGPTITDPEESQTSQQPPNMVVDDDSEINKNSPTPLMSGSASGWDPFPVDSNYDDYVAQPDGSSLAAQLPPSFFEPIREQAGSSEAAQLPEEVPAAAEHEKDPIMVVDDDSEINKNSPTPLMSGSASGWDPFPVDSNYEGYVAQLSEEVPAAAKHEKEQENEAGTSLATGVTTLFLSGSVSKNEGHATLPSVEPQDDSTEQGSATIFHVKPPTPPASSDNSAGSTTSKPGTPISEPRSVLAAFDSLSANGGSGASSAAASSTPTYTPQRIAQQRKSGCCPGVSLNPLNSFSVSSSAKSKARPGK